MREIKFRGWHTIQRKMYFAEEMGKDQLTLSVDGRGFVNVHTYPSMSRFAGDKMIALQFTGLKDKNGKEIYEGDILRIFDDNYEVRIITTECKLYVDYGYPDKHNGPCDSWSEIIGNIYEHRDLLGQTDK